MATVRVSMLLSRLKQIVFVVFEFETTKIRTGNRSRKCKTCHDLYKMEI